MNLYLALSRLQYLDWHGEGTVKTIYNSFCMYVHAYMKRKGKKLKKKLNY